MKILVFGVGGVGGFIGAQILNTDFDISFVARGKRYISLKENGLNLQSDLGNKSLQGIKVYNTIPKKKFDVVISTVKLYDFDKFIFQLKNTISTNDTVLLPFQNGTYSEQKITEEFGKKHTFGAVAQISSYIGENQKVIHKGKLASFFVGHIESKKNDKLFYFCEKSKKAGLDIRLKNNIKEKIWEKFIFLSAYSGITTLTQKTIGEIFEDPKLKEDFIRAMNETLELSKFFSVKFDSDPIAFWIEKIKKMPFDMTSSMYIDYIKGKRLELDWLSGFVVRYSKKYGISSNIHSKILNEIKI
ncbi:MAG: hypothetical protein CBC25_06540 [Pelagibacteraceae bacterium TMED65]|nr:hypothetical protein [Rickettsiales bacterium]OUU51076.1 MAG: hypothetical protein CBC25_06540 [Pelagibacteraceae bacterium TMED65]